MNVYDKEVKIYSLDAGTPLQARLRFVSRHLGREESVYAARFWDSAPITSMPASDSLNASQNVIVSAYAASALFSVTVFCDFSAPLSGGTPMRIEQAQYEYDADGNPVTRLSLRRMDDRFEIAAPEVKP